MFKRTGVTRRNLLGKMGGLGCEVKGVYKRKMVLIERWGDTNMRKKE